MNEIEWRKKRKAARRAIVRDAAMWHKATETEAGAIAEGDCLRALDAACEALKVLEDNPPCKS